MKRLILILGLLAPWMACAEDVTFYDQQGVAVGRASSDSSGNWTIYDQQGVVTGRADRDSSGGYNFYDQQGVIIGSQRGH